MSYYKEKARRSPFKKPSAAKSSPQKHRCQSMLPLKCNEIKRSRPLNATKSKEVAPWMWKYQIKGASRTCPSLHRTKWIRNNFYSKYNSSMVKDLDINTKKSFSMPLDFRNLFMWKILPDVLHLESFHEQHNSLQWPGT